MRVPTQFSVPSSLFSNRETVYINSGLNGNGFISMLPLDTTFCCLYGSDATVAYTGNATNALLPTC